MATASFPDSPSFNEQFIPAPPTWNKEEVTSDEYLDKLSTFMSSQYLGLRNLQNSVASGWLISTLRVLDLDADTITSGTIFTQDLYVGTDGNGGIRLGGTDSQIEITDDSGVTRFLAGDIGGGVWLQISDSSGTVKFQTGSTTFIDGAIITNATVNGSALENTTVTPGKITLLAPIAAPCLITVFKSCQLPLTFGYKSFVKVTLGPTKTSSSTVTPVGMKTKGLILQLFPIVTPSSM